MEIKNIQIAELVFSEYNPREMSNEEFESLKNSIQEFGLVEPIVVNKDLSIIGGHQRVRASQELGHTEVPCVVVDLDKKKEKVLNLALNRIVGTWNEAKLATLIKEISQTMDFSEIKLSGFNEQELEQLRVQYTLIFPQTGRLEPTGEQEIKKAFALNVRVPIDLERPEVVKREGKVAFYTENFEEWEKIRDYFQMKSKSELDTKKLLEFIK